MKRRYTVKRKRFTIIRALFVGDDVRYWTQLNMYEYKGIQEKAAEVNKPYAGNNETFRCIFNGHYLGFTRLLGVFIL